MNLIDSKQLVLPGLAKAREAIDTELGAVERCGSGVLHGTSGRVHVGPPVASPARQNKLSVITIYFDGGCRPTNPGNKYGSCEVMLDGTSVKTISEMALGWGTNNEAEFEILIVALEVTLHLLEDYGFDPKHYRVNLFTDSTIVRNRINGSNRTCRSDPQRRMFERATCCNGFLARFGTSEIHWHRRENNVARFGH